MGESLARGYKVAAATLMLELLLALGLLSDATGIFAILAMVLVGVAWLPAAWMIWAAARDEEDNGTTLAAYFMAGACGMAGGACLLTFGKWTLLTLSVTHG
jgi:hypothetical protein